MSVMTGVFRLGQDAEVRYLPNGDPVATLSLACNYGKKDPGTGFRKSQWYDAGLWGDRAESLAQHLKKGTTVFAVLEDVHIEVYRNRDGADKAKLAARVASIEFVGGRGDRDSQGDAQAPRQASPAPAPAAPADLTPFERDLLESVGQMKRGEGVQVYPPAPAVREPQPEVLQQVMTELDRATRKFPKWPTDPLHALAVLGEEFGELTKAMLQFTYEPHKKVSRTDIREEAIQTAAMALRLAMSLPLYDYAPGPQHKQHGIGGGGK